MADRRAALGREGEDLACETLTRRGYVIVARRYRVRRGEVDIVAWHGETLVFVEVKARRSLACGSGADAVTWMKQHRLVTAAREYLARHRLGDCLCRFDVVSIRYREDGPEIDVLQDAFGASR